MSETKTKRPRRYPTANDLEAAPAGLDGAPAASEPRPVLPQRSALFEASLPLLLAHEGGFVQHPADPGGATNLGISLRYALTRGRLFDLDGDGDVDSADMRLVTRETAAPVYHDDFWKPVRGDDLPPGLGHAAFDAAVNSGPSRAIRWLQAAVGAAQDGVFGPATLLAAQGVSDVTGAIERLCSARLAYMRSLAGWTSFKRGWTARVERIVQEGHRMALGVAA